MLTVLFLLSFGPPMATLENIFLVFQVRFCTWNLYQGFQHTRKRNAYKNPYECMSCQHVIVLLLMCCVFDAVNILVAVTWMYIAFIGNLSSLVSILNEVGKSTKVLWMLQGQILSNMQIRAGRPNSTSNYIVFPPNSTSNLWSSNN